MKLRSLLLTTNLLALAALPAAAQTGETSSPFQGKAGGLEEIEVNGHFVATGASSALKMDIPTLDTPMSVSAYTTDFMQSIQTVQVADMYRYMTGLQKAGATGYNLTLRGFSTTDSDRNAIMTDGLPGLNVRFGSPPTIGTERIEVVRGAASLLYGEVQPGGFVNIISKKPQAQGFTELSVRGTSGASDRSSRVLGGDISIDTTGQVPYTDKLLYRLVAQKSNDTTFRDRSFTRGDYVAPSLTWNIDDDTVATLQVEYRAAQSNYSNVFLLAPTVGRLANLAPYNTNYTAPGDHLHEQGVTESVFLTHTFSDALTWNLAFRNTNHHDTAHAFDIIGFDRKDPTFQTLDLRARGQQNQRIYTFGDTNLTAKFDTIGIGHRMIVGVSLGQETDDFSRTQYCRINSPTSKGDPTCNPTSAIYTVSVRNPNFLAVPPLSYFGPGAISPSARARNYVSGVGSGAYISDLVTLTEQWKALLGLRYAKERQENFNDLNEPNLGGVVQSSDDILPQVGVIFEPSKTWSFYASYSTSFTPVPPGTLGLFGSYNFKPTSGEGVEVGSKTEMEDGKVNFTTALFRIEQNNLIEPFSGTDPIACPNGQSCSQQIGAAKSQGAELELNAKPLPGWTVLAGYAYTLARITKSTAAGPLVGGMLPNSPISAAHLWTRYDFTAGALRGAGVGMGYTYTGARVPFTPTATLGRFTLPAYQVVDFALYYTLENCNLSLMAYNLFDEHYLASGQTTAGMINAQPGVPRTVQLTVSTRF